MSKARVLVLGGGGFIGRRVLTRLVAAGQYEVVAAGRSIAGASFAQSIETVSLDATQAAQLQPQLQRADAVVSCIAGSPQTIVRSADALLSLSAKLSTPPQIVLLSSMAAYGSTTGVVHETNPLLGDAGPYSAAKALIDQRAEPYPFVTRLRPGIVYGPNSDWWSNRIGRLLLARRLGDLGAAGLGFCNLVYVDDVAQAIERCLLVRPSTERAFNLGSQSAPTWNEYFAQYAAVLRAVPVRKISAARLSAELRLIGPALKVAEMLGGRPDRLPIAIRPWLTQLCGQRIRLDMRHTDAVLQVDWTPLSAGLAQSAAWLRQSQP